MPALFSLTVSSDAACRLLAADVARRYFELAGASPADVADVGQKMAATLESFSSAGNHVDVEFSRHDRAIDVSVSCAGRLEQHRFVLATA